MPVSAGWANEARTLVVMRVEDPYSAAEFVHGVDAINALMSTVDHKVNPAVDFSKARELPLGALANYRRIADKMGHPNSTGRLFVVGVKSYLKTMLEIFGRLYRQIEYVNTLDEARLLVRHTLASESVHVVESQPVA